MRRSIGLKWYAFGILLLSILGYSSYEYQTSTDATISINRIELSECYASSGQSKATVHVEIDWKNLESSDVINIRFGEEKKSLNPQLPIINVDQQVVNYLPLSGPQVVSFEVDADGSEKLLSVKVVNHPTQHISLPLLLPEACHQAACNNENALGGTVFFDDDGDAQQSVSEEKGIESVEVILYTCDNSGEPRTTKTASDGTYIFTGIEENKDYQVVFSTSRLSDFYESETTSDNRMVQLVTGLRCNVNLALRTSREASATASDVSLFVPCFVHGAPEKGSQDDRAALLKYPYDGEDREVLATASECGAMWGMAWDATTETLYSAAVLRRHSGLGPLGLAGIYKYSEALGFQPWLDLSFGAVFDFGTIPSNQERGLSTVSNEPDYDPLAWYGVGRMGIGDIDISADGKFLYVINLAKAELYKIEIDADNDSNTAPQSTDIKIIPVPKPCGHSGIARPWGITYYDGNLYVGVTCDASTSRSQSHLRAFIYQFDPEIDSFVGSILDFPLSYPKGSVAIHYPSFGGCSLWNPWSDDYEEWCTSNGFYAYPQPLLSDIEFDTDGSMVIAILDRTSYMLGNDDYLPYGNGFEAAIGSAGDILRAQKIGDKYFLENAGKVKTYSRLQGDSHYGPGNGEFFEDNYYTPNGDLIHSDLGLGALALHPTKNQVIMTGVNPLPFSDQIFSGGMRWQSNLNGQYIRAQIVYRGSGRPFLGKSAGLGDIELSFSQKADFEIGDYVWYDVNGNGIQEPCEPPLSGINICLFNKSTEKIGQTASDENGKYFFSSEEIPGLLPDGKYFISFGCQGQFDALTEEINTEYGSLSLTDLVTDQHLVNSDAVVLSDGQSFTSNPTICITLDQIKNDFSFDVGFKSETEDIVDFALRMTVDPSYSETFVQLGDTVKFLIEVFNQGNVTGCGIELTDYLPEGLSFDLNIGENAQWSLVDENLLVSTLDCVSPGESANACIYLLALTATGQQAWTNYAEISNLQDQSDTDISDRDIDSKLDRIFENNKGSLPTTAADNYLLGDGSANGLDGVAETDQDNVDPAIVNLSQQPFLDLKLQKHLFSKPLNYGDALHYLIVVINEGEVSVRNIIVTDYLAPSLLYDASLNPGWSLNSEDYAVYVITEVLEPGEDVEISFIAICGEVESTDILGFANIAEISHVENVQGEDASDQDIDSTPDANPFNDVSDNPATLTNSELLDNLLNSEGEDDHDHVLLSVNDLALQIEVTTGEGPYTVGDEVEYLLTVSNQGITTVDQIVLADYLPDGMELSLNDYVGWLDEGTGRLLNVIQGPIAPEESVSIPVVLKVNEDARHTGSDILINYAEILDILDSEGNRLADFDSEPANIFAKQAGIEDDEDFAHIIFFALTAQQCDSLVTRTSTNVSVGGNCLTKITPGLIFTGALIPSANDIDSFQFRNANGVFVTDSLIPASLVGTCVDVIAHVDGCPAPFWSQLCLEDKVAPTIVCPPDDTISCDTARLRLFTGTISDCSPVDTLLILEEIEELCTGPFLKRIRRVWQARDAFGRLSDTCGQTVLVRRLDFSGGVQCPADTTLSCDSLEGIPAVIPTSITGKIMVGGITLDSAVLCNASAGYLDQVIRNDTCRYQVLRMWTIVEWICGKDSIIEKPQLITVVDTVAPAISGLPDTLRVPTTTHACEAAVNLPAITFTDACNMSRVSVDIFTPRGAFRDSNGVTVNLPVDTNVVYYNVSDPCHNISRDSIIVIVLDSVGPLAISQTALTINIPLGVKSTTVPASVFDIATVDACGGPIMRQVRRMDSLTFKDSITFNCSDIDTTIMVVLQLKDSLGNASICMISTTISGNKDSCNNITPFTSNNPIIKVAGIVFTDMGIGIPGVKVTASENSTAETDEFGNYEIPNLLMSQTYRINADYKGPFGVGISTYDLVKIQRHILGTEPLENVYRELAADINYDGKVNIVDIVLLRKHILGVEEMGTDESWRFVWADSDEGEEMISTYTIPFLETDMSIDFVGVKIGDVTGDAIDEMEAGPRSRKEEVLYYEIIDIGGYKEVTIKVNRDIDLSGLQTLVKYNPDNLIYRNMSPAALDIGSKHFNAVRIGEMAISWHGSHDIKLKAGDALWRILFESKSGNEWNYGLEFVNANNTYLRSELYEENNIYELRLERAKDDPQEFNLIGNDPNPWDELTKISFDIPRNGMVKLELYDGQNRLVYDRTKIFSAGKQKWQIGNREISQSGVYFGKVTYEGKSRVFKMLRIE